MSLGNVLVIRPGALGDAVLTLPALCALKNAGAESLTVLGTPASWSFFRPELPNPRIADFTSSDWLGLFAEGASLSKDAVAILERTQRAIIYLSGDTTIVERQLKRHGVATRLFQEPPTASNSYSAPSKLRCFESQRTTISERHAARQLINLGGHPATKNMAMFMPFAGAILHWFPSLRDEAANAWKNLDRAQNYFAVHPGSGGRKKCWPAERFAELAALVSDSYDLRALVFFGPADDETRAEFESSVPSRAKWQAVENMPLRDVFTLLHSCRFFVGNDSGMSHLAARIVPTFSIFGPTDPDVWGPIGRRVRILQAANGDLSALDVETVFNALLPMISNPRNLPQT